MKFGPIQRIAAVLGVSALPLLLPVTAEASQEGEFEGSTALAEFDAPAKKGKKGKGKDKKEEAEPEEEVEDEAEPEEEPEPEPEPEPEEDEAEVDAEAAIAGTPAAGGMKGRVGLGGMRSLSGVNAISVRYYPIPKLSIGALVGFATFSHRDTDDNGEFNQTTTVGLLGTGLQLFYWPVQGDRRKYVSADFGFGGRGVFYVGFQPGDENPETFDTPMEIDIEIPITTQVFIGDAVAITPEFGFVVRIIPGNREPDEQDNVDTNPGSGVGGRLGTTNGPGLGFEMGEHGGVFFGLSITYYFGGENAKKRKAAKKAKKGK